MSMNLDELARGLSSGTVSRRRALALLGAAAVGTLIPGVARATEPYCRKEYDECNYSDKKCCPEYECKADSYGRYKCVKREECRKKNEYCNYSDKKCCPEYECKNYKCKKKRYY